MDLDTCFPGNRRFTRVVSRVWRPGLFYHKVALRLAAFACQDLNATSCWVIRNHLRYKGKIPNFEKANAIFSRTVIFLWLVGDFRKKKSEKFALGTKPCQQKLHVVAVQFFYIVKQMEKCILEPSLQFGNKFLFLPGLHGTRKHKLEVLVLMKWYRWG